MTWRNEKTDSGYDLVWDGVEKGIAPSPTQGTANLQNVNISTETGEVMVSYDRIKQNQVAVSSGTMTASIGAGTTLLDVTPTNFQAGQWIKVTASSVSSITATTGATTVAVSYLAVGGGGAGGAATTDGAAGGGGAGQVATGTSSAFTVATYAVTIGAGGDGNTIMVPGNSGNSTTVGAVITAVGGGAGGLGEATYPNGVTGGSGGGAGGHQATVGTVGTATAGFAGGLAVGTANNNSAGGGGGAGAVGAAGATATFAVGGAGGAGVSSSISGTATFYGGGGGGGAQTNGGPVGGGVGGLGGSSIGGRGGGAGTTGSTTGFSASANTGSGGGGGGNADAADTAGGSGGSGIVILSYVTGSCVATGGAITYSSTNTIHTFLSDGVFDILWVNPGGYYFVSYRNTSDQIKLSATYDPYGLAPITHGTSGTITFDTVTSVGSPIAKATEKFGTTTDAAYRYYILDSLGYIWVYDTDVYASTLASSGVGTKWMLPDPTTNTFPYTGMGVLNGFLVCLNNRQIYMKPTVNLGQPFVQMTAGQLTNPFPIHNNYVLTGHQGKLHYCDGNYIGEIFPTTSFITSLANIQSYAKYTASSTTGTISPLLGGSTPWTLNASGTTARIPAVFFTSPSGTLPTALTQNTVYYIEYNVITYTFKVYSAITGGSSLNIATGATGTQYFNTFWPFGTDAGSNGTHPTIQFTPQRVDLPFTEESQCLVEVGNTILIGCAGNTIYPWNQVDATPSDLIALPEKDVQRMINVNNMVYVFAGNKGNIYVTNGSVASLALKVPDYCAGVPGTPLTYIEPYFTWGDAMYLRGRVYFSILDQTATKAGNCGGIWSFTPIQNLVQDTGQALHLENENSYGTFSGMATVLLPSENQLAVSPQYWSGWQTSYSVATSSFGIDFTSTVPVPTAYVETDLLATGTFLSKRSFSQLEFKVATPMHASDEINLYWRLNGTNDWTFAGASKLEANRLSGYVPVNFQKTQWIQVKAYLVTNQTTNSSFNRVKEIRLR